MSVKKPQRSVRVHGRAIRGTLKEEKELIADGHRLYTLTKGQHFGSASEKANDMKATLDMLDEQIAHLREAASQKRLAYGEKVQYNAMIEEAKAQRRHASSALLAHKADAEKEYSDDVIARANADPDLLSPAEKLGLFFGVGRRKKGNGSYEGEGKGHEGSPIKKIGEYFGRARRKDSGVSDADDVSVDEEETKWE